MMERRYILASSKIRDNAIRDIRCAPIGYEVTIQESSRTIPQNDGFHPRIREIAQRYPLCGQIRSEEQARLILMSGFRTWQGEQIEMATGLEGEPIALGLSTRKLKKSEASQFIEWLDYVEAKLAAHNERAA